MDPMKLTFAERKNRRGSSSHAPIRVYAPPKRGSGCVIYLNKAWLAKTFEDDPKSLAIAEDKTAGKVYVYFNPDIEDHLIIPIKVSNSSYYYAAYNKIGIHMILKCFNLGYGVAYNLSLQKIAENIFEVVPHKTTPIQRGVNYY